MPAQRRTRVARSRNTRALRAANMRLQAEIKVREQAEQALRESEDRFRRLAENAPDIIFRFEYMPGRHFSYVSRAITTVTGYTPEEYYANPDLGWRQLHVDDRERFQRLISDPETIRKPIEMRWLHRDGTAVWVEQINVPLFDATGHLVAIEGIVRDISERRRTSEALRLSEARLQLLLSKTPAVIFSAWAEGDFRTTFISESIRSVLGYEPDEAMGGTSFWASRIHPEDKARVFSDAARLFAQGWRLYEYRCRHADGSYRWIESGVSLLPGIEDQPAEVIGYIINVTERKQAETVLRRANAELARVARVKDEFLANVSHELRTPLNTILGLSELLREQIRGPLNPRQQDAIQSIEVSGQHLLDLINDILDLSKVEAGRLDLQVEPVHVIELCQSSLLLVKELAIKKSLQLLFQPHGLPALIEADPKRLKQMLVNLLSNAVKFTPEGGQVCLEVTGDAAAGQVIFTVLDTGIGIAPEDLARLFQPFSQLDSSLSRQHEGTGLGLALVRRLAELHGGRVSVESEIGVGSRFTVSLPAGQIEAATMAAGAAARSRAESGGREAMSAAAACTPAGVRILLTDDNHTNILAIDEYLRVRGYEVVVAHSGQEALDRVDTVRPAVILMDIQMPGLDGLDVIRRLRSRPDFATTPIIVLTALAMSGDRERCMAAGANAYLAKPISLRRLVELIEQFVYE
jgi:PAS domain S-box-containing protein